MRFIDSHVHLGCNRNIKYYGEKELWRDLKEAGAQGAVIFAFPEDMYRIADTRGSRIEAIDRSQKKGGFAGDSG